MSVVSDVTDEAIGVVSLVKHFRRSDGEVVRAVDDVSISVAKGEFLVLLGPSGCGKTTLLRCLAGLEHPDSGQIALNGTTVFSDQKKISLPPESREAGMMFQSYALWPHMRIRDNVAYPLRCDRSMRGRKREISERVLAMLNTVECGQLEAQYPGQISGGQQQRIALARALVKGDPVVFFDEPLSNVDARLRDQLRLELKLAQQRLGFSAIYVTHDQSEALALADRVAVLRKGVVAQIGTPREVYDHPTSAYVARFMGDVNEVRGKVVQEINGQLEVITDLGTIPMPPQSLGYVPGDSVIVMMRPLECQLTETEPSSEPLRSKVTVEAQLFLGTRTEVAVISNDGVEYTVWRAADQPAVQKEQSMWMSIPLTGNVMIVPDDSAAAGSAA